MTKKEIYAWSSLASSGVLLAFYLIAAFGWPDSLEGYSDYVIGIFWKVLGIAVAIEFALDLMKSLKVGGVQKDERDKLIEAKGYRNAYYFLMVTLITLIVHLLLSDLISKAGGEHMFLSIPFMTLHLLVIILFVAHITKSTTQLYFYNKH